jgi:trans-2,3-dihydro-3-hydroxyanthranilate isomerase
MSTHPSPRSLPFAQLDVFAEHPLSGNALAVFTDAGGLSAAEMQSLARETNLSETTFLLRRPLEIEREAGVAVRIFTTVEELPFAGHPTLGTAAWLYSNHPELLAPGSHTIRLDLRGGRIPVTFQPPHPGHPGLFGTMRQNDPIFGETHDLAEIAAALGLSPADLHTSAPPQTVSTGLPFCIVPLRSLEAISRLRIPADLGARFLAGTTAKFFFCIAPADPASGADWRARMQFYSGEDPATGSASGCAISWLVHHGLAASAQPVVLEQGIEISRPSRIHLRATRVQDRITDVFVGGRTIPVANGRFFLP